MHEVVRRLKEIIPQSIYQQQDDGNISASEDPVLNSIEASSHGELSQLIKNFHNMNANEIEFAKPTSEQITSENISSEKDLRKIVGEIVTFIFELSNKGIDLARKHTLEYFSNNNINSKEIYNWLLNNQNDSDSIFLLGCFHYYGIETIINYEKAFSLFINLSEQNHTLAQYFAGECYYYGYGVTKNEKLAFEYYEKVANKDYAAGQLDVGYCYKNGVGIEKDFKMAAKWYEKAAKNGNIIAMKNLGLLYENGDGVNKDHNKDQDFS